MTRRGSGCNVACDSERVPARNADGNEGSGATNDYDVRCRTAPVGAGLAGARRRGAGRGGYLACGCQAAGDPGGDRRRRGAGPVALGGRRPALFPRAHRRGRRGLCPVCARAQRRARILAIAGALDRRPPLQPAFGRNRADRLFGRRRDGADRRLPGLEGRRGGVPHRRPVPVQRPDRHRGRLAHGRSRRVGHPSGGPAIPDPGRDRAGADACGCSAKRC